MNLSPLLAGLCRTVTTIEYPIRSSALNDLIYPRSSF